MVQNTMLGILNALLYTLFSVQERNRKKSCCIVQTKYLYTVKENSENWCTEDETLLQELK